MRRRWCLVALLALTSGSCATLQQIAALRSVDFALGGVEWARLAGVDVTDVRTYEDLSLIDAGRLTAAVARGELPLVFRLRVDASNPADNQVTARLVQMDWTLLIEDRETVSGVVEREYAIPPGDTRTIGIDIELDLLEFFERNAADLMEIALAVTGNGGERREIALQALPTIQTALGPIRYPEPITIVRGSVGTPERGSFVTVVADGVRHGR